MGERVVAGRSRCSTEATVAAAWQAGPLPWLCWRPACTCARGLPCMPGPGLLLLCCGLMPQHATPSATTQPPGTCCRPSPHAPSPFLVFHAFHLAFPVKSSMPGLAAKAQCSSD